ncbi:CTP synthase C-terminal region-related (seleno)protein [Microtetraspora niveoalba]|uniref:CTP synthase C-terminal region-related (seleno)protein n=1 Tax=Microtetraspora niveoalba TaxID=46175 RepID=UPI0008319B44|nr:hypothetical protein [Microtetraspora niveoalba]
MAVSPSSSPSLSSSAFAARVALVGDRSPHVRAHVRVPFLLDALRERELLDLDVYWIPTDEVGDGGVVAGFDGIWLVPGSPYRSEEGAVAAVRAAREAGIPFLGTCGGFQHALLEYARNVCGLAGASHGENGPGGGQWVIAPLACSLVGHQGVVRVAAGSLAEEVLGTNRTMERYHCSYGLNPDYLDVLREHGMRFTGVDEEGAARVAELAGHPFFLCTLFQPELGGDEGRPHPVIRAFAAAAARRAAARERA